jgi:hypothetical protein
MESIEKLSVLMEMRVNPDYHQLRVEDALRAICAAVHPRLLGPRQ